MTPDPEHTPTPPSSDGGVFAPFDRPLFEVVLHEPQIPNNTGNIGRTCVATACALHLIHPLGFDVSEKACRRAGLDYWPRLGVREHADWAGYERAEPSARRWRLSTRASRPLFEADFEIGDHLVFGSETAGLPDSILDAEPDRCVALPMQASERSLNVATAVCAVIYEALRQLHAQRRIAWDTQARLTPGPNW